MTKRWLGNLGLVLFGTLVAVALAELAVRIVEPPADTAQIELTDSLRSFGYEPNSEGWAGGVRYRTNSLGFRGDEPPAEGADPNALTVVVLGDSYAFGYGVEEDESFPEVMKDLLEADDPDRPIRLLNFSASGYNTRQEALTLKELGPIYQPDIVILGYHLNDIQNSAEARPDDDYTSFITVLRDAKRNLHLLNLVLPRLAHLARSMGFEVKSTVTAEMDNYLKDGPLWRANQVELENVIAEADTLGAKLGVVILPYIIDLTETHPPRPAYEIVETFLHERDVQTIMAVDYLMGMNAGALWINMFDGHPNAVGHEAIARAAFDLVKSLEESGLDRPRDSAESPVATHAE